MYVHIDVCIYVHVSGFKCRYAFLLFCHIGEICQGVHKMQASSQSPSLSLLRSLSHFFYIFVSSFISLSLSLSLCLGLHPFVHLSALALQQLVKTFFRSFLSFANCISVTVSCHAPRPHIDHIIESVNNVLSARFKWGSTRPPLVLSFVSFFLGLPAAFAVCV